MTLAQALEALAGESYIRDVDAEGGWKYIGRGQVDGKTCPRCFGAGWIRFQHRRVTCATCYVPQDTYGSIP